MAPQADDPFPDKPESDAADTKPDPAVAEAAALTAAISAALEKHVSPLNQHIANLNKQVEALSRVNTPRPTPNPDPPENDTLTAFMDNPEGTMEKHTKGVLAKTVVPAIKLQLEQGAESILEGHREAIDREFGKGTWGELFEKEVKTELDGLPLEMLASKRHVLQAVSAVYGRLYMDPDHRSKLDGKRTEASKAMDSPTMLSGTGRARPNNAEDLNQDESTFIAALNKSGFSVDKNSYLTARKLGGNEAAWASHFAKKRAAAAKAAQ